MCFDRGRERHRHRHGEKYPEIQVSCEASDGVEGYTCQCPGTSLSFSLCRFSVQLDMQETLNPPPSLHLPDPGQFSPAMHGHLWEFIPDASCSLHPLLSLPLSLSVTPPSQSQSTCLPLNYMSHLYFLKHKLKPSLSILIHFNI